MIQEANVSYMAEILGIEATMNETVLIQEFLRQYWDLWGASKEEALKGNRSVLLRSSPNLHLPEI